MTDTALAEGALALGVTLTARQHAQLLAYAALILKWNKVYNLTALRDPSAVLTHHLLDSLSVVLPLRRELAARRDGAVVEHERRRLLDVGAGAGLPGAVIAIVNDDIDVTCIDAVAKKTAFVQQVATELKLPNLRATHGRIENVSAGHDIVSSRAFASLKDFFEGSRNALAADGIWLAMKGRVPTDELAQVPAGVQVFHVEQLDVPGLDAERCIVWARHGS